MTNPRLKIPTPAWITNTEQLARECAFWQGEGYIALDTEFIRTDTFYPIAGLIQVADSRGCYIIDPLCIDDWSAFANVLQHPLVVKSLHACAEDIEVFRCLCDCVPAPLCDTQLAAGFLGFGPTLGFQSMVKHILNVNLDKEETRSDWLKRPLSDAQVHYATADVHYLYRAYPKLMAKLKLLGRDHWLVEDCDRLVRLAQQPDNPAGYYQRVKMGWKLRGQEQFVLQQLAIWRERTARSGNVPRARISNDETLLKLSRSKPTNADDLRKAGLGAHMVDEQGEAVLMCIQQALGIDRAHWPKPLPKPLSTHAGSWYKHMKHAVSEKAEVLAIPPEYLARKKALEDVLRSGYPRGPYRLPDILSGWRKAEIGEYLIAILTEQSTQSPP